MTSRSCSCLLEVSVCRSCSSRTSRTARFPLAFREVPLFFDDEAAAATLDSDEPIAVSAVGAANVSETSLDPEVEVDEASDRIELEG